MTFISSKLRRVPSRPRQQHQPLDPVKMRSKILLTLVVLKVYGTGLYNKIIQFSPIMQHYDINISSHWLLETLGEGITFHCQSPKRKTCEEEEGKSCESRREWTGIKSNFYCTYNISVCEHLVGLLFMLWMYASRLSRYARASNMPWIMTPDA